MSEKKPKVVKKVVNNTDSKPMIALTHRAGSAVALNKE